MVTHSSFLPLLARRRFKNVCLLLYVIGLEFDALFISTVRTYNTMTTETMDRSDLGFLSDPKLLNTAVTRAKYHLCVIGDPNALCAVGLSKVCWKTILAK